MLDLETMGNGPRAAIVAIGAVRFGGAAGGVDEAGAFYARVSLESSVECGLEMDASTVLWWMRQSEAARRELNAPTDKLPVALARFADWIGPSSEGLRVWGNGAEFDNVILASAYRACALPLPWRYSGNRCYRTLKWLFPEVEIERAGTHHRAVDDAISQARHLMRFASKQPIVAR